jgi:glycosyltransferase involved in cell wall biosynthesis
MQTKPTVVFSAVNLTEAGPLSIAKDAVLQFLQHCAGEYNLVLLAFDKKLYANISGIEKATIIEYRYPKRSWFFRIFFEYIHCYFISKRIKAFCWLALHDMTPWVSCARQAVYCHNPAIFYRLSLREARLEKSLVFFSAFYGFFYGFLLKRNKYVIVQQEWLRREFKNRFKITNLVVAHPQINLPSISAQKEKIKNAKIKFFYPSLPRVFKNVEIILEAASLLATDNLPFEIFITIDGTENAYSKWLKKKYGHLTAVHFAGRQSRETIFKWYQEMDCLIFPSKLETWGLPISEAKAYRKDMLLAALPYAWETVGHYERACFFSPYDSLELATLIKNYINGNLKFVTTPVQQPKKPFAGNWQDLFNVVLKDQYTT